jgi:hypothetical protein
MSNALPLLEHQFMCPYCWETISMVLDCSVETQDYIEDCEVCCNPIHISYEIADGDLNYFEAAQSQ